LAEVRRADGNLAQLKKRIADAVAVSGTHVADVHGAGPIIAAYLIGYSGDICRFPTAGHYARYNATAPIAASSGPNPRHRLNPRGNRQLNHAIHMIAVTQVRNDTPGRAYYLRKQAEGKNRKEAMGALETPSQRRRLPTATRRHDQLNQQTGPEGQPGTTLQSSVAGSNPEHRHFGTTTPGPNPNATTTRPTPHTRAPKQTP
jgi:transposase